MASFQPDRSKEMEKKVQQLIGGYIIEILLLQTQLEEAKAKIAELERPVSE